VLTLRPTFKPLWSAAAGLNALVWAAVVLVSMPAVSSVSARPPQHPPIHHVFIIVLENKNFAQTFGPNSSAPYLSRVLTKRGALLEEYYGIGHASLDNYIAMISGQAATPQTRQDCDSYADFTLVRVTSDGQAVGRGCVYPATIPTLAGQLTRAGKTWRAYMEDMGNDPQRERATCGHPAINSPDQTQGAEPRSEVYPQGDQYAVRHNPFVYFHSVIDSPECDRAVLPLSRLVDDLAHVRTTANLTFISPNLCNDGHDVPCVNGEPGGLKAVDTFLQTWVPRIEASEAYRRDGLLVITFDEGDASVESHGDGYIVRFDGEKCCDERPGPNLAPFPQAEHSGNYTIEYSDFGGDRTGTLLLSPFIVPGSISTTPFNHFALLKSIEDLFGLHQHLGYAGAPGLVGFFDAPSSDVKVRARPNSGETHN
jgi:phosphatidylinositol-3-phosphatase